jgi:hypothetical protein
METHGGKSYVEQLMRSCLAPEVLLLKEGAQVMFIKNAQDRRYANGSLGTIIGFEDATDYPIVELVNGKHVVARPDTWELMDGDKRRAQLSQLPLRLAWAITVHKSQGMTLDAARIDLSRAFVEGMGYVALSRVRSIKHLLLDGLNGMALRVSPLAKQIDTELRARSSDALVTNAVHISQWQTDESSGKHEKQAAQATANAETLTPEGELLFERLREWRRGMASEKSLPSYIIAHDKTLKALAMAKPQSEKDLLKVAGFGPMKTEQYGADILAITAAKG